MGYQGNVASLEVECLSSAGKAIRTMLADDHRMFRQCLRALLDAEAGIEVIGEAGNGSQAISVCEQCGPDVIVMDVSMGEMTGMEATSRLVERRPQTKIIGLSMHSEPQTAGAMLNAGAAGYLTKEAACEELAGAIRAVMEGKIYLSEPMARALYKSAYDPVDLKRNARKRRKPLSPRERDVLGLMADGRSMKEIGEILGMSVKTAETHRRKMMDKLGLYSIAELTRFAICEGLIEVEGWEGDRRRFIVPCPAPAAQAVPAH